MLYVIVSANSNEITFFMLYAVVGILSMMTDSKGIYNRSAQLIHPDGYLIRIVLPLQSLETIKVCKIDQIFQINIKNSSSCAC